LAWQRGFAGVVTCNYKMLGIPETVAVIMQTRLTVVACHAKTNKVRAATGLLLINLDNIARNLRPGTPQMWELTQPLTTEKNIRLQVARVERNWKCNLKDYYLSDAALKTPVIP
jgi:hypothetical protein